ncbi:MAG: DEAD/DEAH box helicase [Nitrososphaerota archaeon]|jgi:replicative superfamily II helicase|nr:DEAD/DEAH box helicase [Nitrososphaerota archaeon]
MTVNSDVLAKFIGPKNVDKIQTIVQRRKLSKTFPTLSQQQLDGNNSYIEKMLDALQLSAINLWNPESADDINKFKVISNRIVDLIQILPLPADEFQKINRLISLITYGYLGDNWEAVRRLLIEREKELTVDSNTGEWAERVFKSIYMAIFYLIRRKSWEDLRQAILTINNLRLQQKQYEKSYLEANKECAVARAFELASLYHLAKSVELIGTYHLKGQPIDILELLDFQFENAIKYAEKGNIVSLNLMERMLQPTFKKMVENCVWTLANKVNSRVKKFVDLLVKGEPPIIEFLHPQRYSILEQGLLDPAHKAVVVNLPTSSGKTLVAEFRILQALNQFSGENGWIAYIVPTRALVNQITLRLRNDLSRSPLNIKIEKMSSALEIDAFEMEIIKSKNSFDILVTTPEKLSLLLRQNIERTMGRPLILAVVDEAHNIESKERGMNLEALLAIIKKDCPMANFLLLTPFVPNADELAKWLDPQHFKSIDLGIHFWKPNDTVIGELYGNMAHDGSVCTYFKPLLTSRDSIYLKEEILIKKDHACKFKRKDLNKKYLLTGLIASQLDEKQESTLIIARTKGETYKIANLLYDRISNQVIDPKIELVKRFIAAELGDSFPLIKYLDKGIGIHHAGLPDDIRSLMEQLMEARLLNYLIATTTIAQGINFDVSTILMAAYNYPWTSHMPPRDFWNLIGRVGRVYSISAGTVGIAIKGDPGSEDSLKLAEFVRESTNRLVSSMVETVNSAFESAQAFDLTEHYRDPGWSMFLQYIAHMFSASKSLEEFIAETEMTLRRTYFYNQLSAQNKVRLSESVKQYASAHLDKDTAALSDSTGFCPETIKSIIKVKGKKLTKEDWKASKMFSTTSDSLKQLVGIMLRTPEIKQHLKDVKIKGQSADSASLASIITDWVQGKDIMELSEKYFAGANANQISDCVNVIYGQLTMSAAWGLAAFEKLPTSGIDGSLSVDEKRQLSNLPAMVYYGVDTDEAVLLRKASVPRTISRELGKKVKEQIGTEVFHKTTNDISIWLKDLPDADWQNAVTPGKLISGNDYKQIWQLLSGFLTQ